MSKKKNSKSNNFPYSNEIKKAREGFKKMIDEMSDEEFLDFSFLIATMIEDLEDDMDDDFYDDLNNDFDNECFEDEALPF